MGYDLKKEIKRLLENDKEIIEYLKAKLVKEENVTEETIGKEIKNDPIVALEERINNLEKQNAEYRDDVRQIWEASDKLNSQKKQLESNNNNLSEELASLKVRNNELSKEIATLNISIENIKVIEDENNELAEERNKLEEEKISLVSKINMLNIKVEASNEEVKIINNKLIDLQTTNNEIIENNLKLEKQKEDLIDEVKTLEIEVEEIKLELADMKSNFDDSVKVIEEKDELLSKNEVIISSNEKELELLRPFAEWLDIYKLYDQLSTDTKESLKGIFKGQDILRFVYCGLQEGNIENLWEYIKSEVLNNRTENIESLNAIFDKFFNSYNMIFEVPVYKTQEVSVGNDFDDYDHIRTSDSMPSGSIKEVVLYGYVNKKGKAIKKSIVRI